MYTHIIVRPRFSTHWVVLVHAMKRAAPPMHARPPNPPTRTLRLPPEPTIRRWITIHLVGRRYARTRTRGGRSRSKLHAKCVGETIYYERAVVIVCSWDYSQNVRYICFRARRVGPSTPSTYGALQCQQSYPRFSIGTSRFDVPDDGYCFHFRKCADHRLSLCTASSRSRDSVRRFK
jgi:hypothetical protein